MNETTEAESKNLYEITFLVKEESTAPVLEILAKNGGVVIEEKSAQKVQLEYEIKDFLQAFLGIVKFSAEPETLQKINQELNLNAEVLRFLITKPIKKVDRGQIGGVGETDNNDEGRTPTGYTQSRTAGQTMPTGRQARRKKEDEFPSLTNEALQEKIEEILK